ncbi:MAG: antibiotic biosynthesis monooxygenase [Candidatus Methylomirabilales bacterium]
MSIRVIIERQTIPGCELQLNELLTEQRALAVQAKGYISGETLRSLDDPCNYIVISTWSTVEDWRDWASSGKRKEMQLRIDRLLQRPSTHRVYTHGD